MVGSVQEAENDQSPINAALKQAIQTVSQDQEITFELYIRLTLPLDGYVFWVKSDLVSQTALYNAFGFDTSTFNESLQVTTPASQFTVKGSLHYATDKSQVEDQNYAINHMIFTSEDRIEPLNAVGPNTLWIASYNGFLFGFGAHGNFYEAAGLYHYKGDALYPDMQPQVITKLSDFDQSQIVSNSLPIWLSMNNYASQVWEAFNNYVPLYSSFVLPSNISLPWGSVHIIPETTQNIAAFPTYDSTYGQVQLTQEHVRITLYGLNNNQALEFASFVQQYAANSGDIGIMNIPTIRDDKRIQVEFGILSKKKVIEFDVNYYQSRANTIARELIKQAIPTYYVDGEALL